MTIEEQNEVQTAGYNEAMRYMQNAEETLKRSKKDDWHYTDEKYVRTACGTAYNGVLIALDAWLECKGVDVPRKPRRMAKGTPKPKSKPQKSIEFYERNLAQLDKKLLKHLDSAYGVLHLDGYYDGITNVKIIAAGFEMAYEIIERIKPWKEED